MDLLPEKTPKKKGRPSLLNEERQHNITTMLKAGAYIEDAVKASGISVATFYVWMNRGKAQRDRQNANLPVEENELPYLEFLEAVEMADAEGAIGHLMNIDHHAKNGTWQASAWILERKYPKKWGRYDHTEISGPDGGPIHINVSTEELERKIARILERRELEA